MEHFHFTVQIKINLDVKNIIYSFRYTITAKAISCSDDGYFSWHQFFYGFHQRGGNVLIIKCVNYSDAYNNANNQCKQNTTITLFLSRIKINLYFWPLKLIDLFFLEWKILCQFWFESIEIKYQYYYWHFEQQ